MTKKEIICEIDEITYELYEIGDQDEATSKNFVNGFCSIYYYNDLKHLIDYGSNGHRKKDTKKFKELWYEILDLVKDLKPKNRKSIIDKFINKDINCYDKYVDTYYYNELEFFKTLH